MSGGKGGSTSTSVEVPEFIRGPAERNLQRAEQVQQIGYMPYMGVDVAAPTQGMQNLMQQRGQTAEAFGIVGPGYDALSGLPESQTIGGVTGYRSFDPYQASIEAGRQMNPEQYERYDALFQGTPEQQVGEMSPEEAASLLGQIAMQAQGGNSDGGNGNGGFSGPLSADQSYQANTPSGMQFGVAEFYRNVQENPLMGLVSPIGTAVGGFADRNLQNQGYGYVRDPNARGGGYYTRNRDAGGAGNDDRDPGATDSMRGERGPDGWGE